MNPVVRPCEPPEPAGARSRRRSVIVALTVLMALTILMASAAPFDRAAATNLQQSFSHARCPVSGRTTVRPGECVEIRVKRSALGDFDTIDVFSPGMRASGLVFNFMGLYAFPPQSGETTGGFSKRYLGGATLPPGDYLVLGKICAPEPAPPLDPGQRFPSLSPGEKEPYRLGAAGVVGDSDYDYSRTVCLEYFREER